ncbi:hypothetical protein BUALT_Bualt01G0143900 [Buddleja alternifolia]|uniref:Uncharacterized protein n=1 Tax=Buddleja alternifolia TaxID=168488 RepID=A0AAV6Y840_9LAMI|nr:hypothetical protein BUALT_Bualt01G0143900 [Buddleja alternifolia]
MRREETRPLVVASLEPHLTPLDYPSSGPVARFTVSNFGQPTTHVVSEPIPPPPGLLPIENGGLPHERGALRAPHFNLPNTLPVENAPSMVDRWGCLIAPYATPIFINTSHPTAYTPGAIPTAFPSAILEAFSSAILGTVFPQHVTAFALPLTAAHVYGKDHGSPIITLGRTQPIMIGRFNDVALEVPSASADVLSNIFAQGLNDNEFFRSLSKKPPIGFDNLLTRAKKYMNMEEATQMKRVETTTMNL